MIRQREHVQRGGGLPPGGPDDPSLSRAKRQDWSPVQEVADAEIFKDHAGGFDGLIHRVSPVGSAADRQSHIAKLLTSQASPVSARMSRAGPAKAAWFSFWSHGVRFGADAPGLVAG
jgi:hypothetical protein